MNPDAGGTFLGDENQTLKLIQKYWGLNIGNFAMLTSQPVAGYHSRVVNVHGDMCLGKDVFFFPFYLNTFVSQLMGLHGRYNL